MNKPMEREYVRTRIWAEEAEADNEFATRVARCHGYDVYGEMLGRSRWVEMLYLLFRGEVPLSHEADLLESLAVALANPGPRDPAVHAAMCGGVGGSPAASCLVAALAAGAGGYGGGHEVAQAMAGWLACDTDLNAWLDYLAAPADERASIWPTMQHPPGFNPRGLRTELPVLQSLECLARNSRGIYLPWLMNHRATLEVAAGSPLAMAGVAAAALADLGFSPEQGEMVFLLLRLPGAAAHALEQKSHGYKKFPFFAVELTDGRQQEVK